MGGANKRRDDKISKRLQRKEKSWFSEEAHLLICPFARKRTWGNAQARQGAGETRKAFTGKQELKSNVVIEKNLRPIRTPDKRFCAQE